MIRDEAMSHYIKLSDKQFREAMERAAKAVASWAEWKRNVLVKTSSPTVDVPRKPIVGDDE